MKKVSRRELARTVTRQMLDGKDPERVMLELAAYLIDTKQISQADMLLSDISGFLRDQTGHVEAEVLTVFGLSGDSKQKLESFLQQAFDAKSVEINAVEDKSLIGGVVVKTPGYEYDASVRRKLNALSRGEA